MPKFIHYSTMYRSKIPKVGIEPGRVWLAFNGTCYSISFR